jgi:hypothetical protein
MEFVIGAIKEMAKTGTLTDLPKGKQPTVVISIGVVRK